MPQLWDVVGGADKGGILVRADKSVGSPQLPDRLSTGALVEELELVGERLKYKLLSGDGPTEGWVSIRLPGKELLTKSEKTLEDAMPEAAEPAEPEQPAQPPRIPEQEPEKEGWHPIPPEIWATFPKVGDGPEGRPKKMGEFKAAVVLEEPGEYWGIKFPFTPKMLKDMGPEWLTKAMHTTGVLPKDNAVIKLVSMDVKAEDVTKQDAENAKWGGAGLKILLKVKYKNGPGDLTEGMFIKMPHEFTGKNERYKNSVTSFGMDWSEVTFYNVFGGRFGHLPFKSPMMYFCDICRKTTNFVNIVEMIPYAKSGTKDVGPGQYFPAPEKYRDWALPNKGIDLYYAHARSLARFFGWHRTVMQQTDQVETIFMGEGGLGSRWGIWGAMMEAGTYNCKERDTKLMQMLTQDPGIMGFAQSMAFPPASCKGFLDMGVEFITKTAPQAFPKEYTAKPFIDKFSREAAELAKYCCEIAFCMFAMPEYFALCHPNAQVDNAFYWKDMAGETQCGLLDWGGVNHGTVPNCLGNGWMGAEPEAMEEHEANLVKVFVDEYEKVSGFRYDEEDLLLYVKLAQGSVLFGCCANIGMLLRTYKKDEWKTIKGRMDPKIDENFLMRCYYVQIELFLKMWTLKNSPYIYFKKWMKRLSFPDKP